MVPQGICCSCRLQGKDHLAEFRRDQLPREHLAERQTDRQADEVAGAWRTYEFNITDTAILGKTNVLAVQVFSPTDTDLAITFVDWNPAPPDKNMGLFREC